jgi:phosphate transport system permease protein
MAQERSAASRLFANRAFLWACLVAMNLAVLVLVVLLVSIFWQGWDTLSWKFITNFASRKPSEAGIAAPLWGSVWVCAICGLVALPLGVGTAIYLEEFAKRTRFTRIVQTNIMNLAGVPSIVYGLLALGLFVYGLGTGRSIFTAGLTLALLILPIIIVATRESIRAVPQSLREAAIGLGATEWQVTRDHVLPAASPGILTGVIIGISRALGETAPLITIGALTFIAFLPQSPVQSDFPFLNFGWLSDSFTVLPIQAFNWISRPGSDFASNAAAASLVLLVLTLGLNGAAIWLRARLRRKLKW